MGLCGSHRHGWPGPLVLFRCDNSVSLSLRPLGRVQKAGRVTVVLRCGVCAATFLPGIHSRRAECCEISVMSTDGSDSDDSEISEGRRAARDRLAPKTQRDYSGYISELRVFACKNSAEFADCMTDPTTVTMPVALKLGKAFVCYLRDKLISWPMDPRPEERRTYLKHYSRAKINNACIAIKNTYRLLSVPLPAADLFFYNDFAHSYINILARDKGLGAFPSVEGTVALGSAQIKKVINAAFRYGCMAVYAARWCTVVYGGVWWFFWGMLVV